jgi:hypothetical protein
MILSEAQRQGILTVERRLVKDISFSMAWQWKMMKVNALCRRTEQRVTDLWTEMFCSTAVNIHNIKIKNEFHYFSAVYV